MPETIPHPVLHFEGLVQVAEARGYHQGYLQFPFEVPPGTGALRLSLRYSPAKASGVNNVITLGLFDPRGFRGNAHRGSPHPEVYLSAGTATPGFLPGPIRPGLWLAQLACHAVMASDPPCAYTLDVELLPENALPPTARSPRSARPASPFTVVRSPRAGWYRGELHSHTLHSDGALTPGELLAAARARGLDFLAVTDHNTVTALDEIEQPADDPLLVIPGLELTTFCGHALVLGVERWIDWRMGYNGWDMNAAARAAHAAGGLFVIAHPQDIDSPACTGCRWFYPDFDRALADGLEIWNEGWRGPNDKNPDSLQLWRELQNEARHLPATAGSDFHGGSRWTEAEPSAYVFAHNLSTAAILEGVRLGRMVLSSGPWLQVQVSTGSGSPSAGIGDTLVAAARRVLVSAAWERAPQGAEWILFGRRGALLKKTVAGEGKLQEWVDVLPEDRLWVELWSTDGLLLAFANPVYIQPAT